MFGDENAMIRLFPSPPEDLGGSNNLSRTIKEMTLSFRPLARIFWGANLIMVQEIKRTVRFRTLSRIRGV